MIYYPWESCIMEVVSVSLSSLSVLNVVAALRVLCFREWSFECVDEAYEAAHALFIT